MVELILVMAAIILTWAVVGVALFGVGAAVHRTLKHPIINHRGNWLIAFWIGLAFCIAYLQVWHLFFPVNRASLVMFLLIGWGCLLINWRDVIALTRNLRNYPVYVLLFAFIVILASNNALSAPAHYDTGLYQLQSIRWANTYAIVPGLGNLHGRLAFNNAFHLYIAMLNEGFLVGRGTHLANGIPLLVMAAIGLSGLYHVRQHQGRASSLYWAMTLPVTLRHLFHISLHSPDNDLLVLLVGLVAVGILFELIERSKPDRLFHLFAIVTLIALGVTFKLSFGILGLALMLLVFAIHLWDRQPLWHIVAVSTGIAFLLVIPWIARGVIGSGYPLYPGTILPFPVDWRMPAGTGQRELLWVQAWARQPGIAGGLTETPVIEGFAWLVPWFFRTFTTTPNLFDVTLPLGISIGAIGWKVWQRDEWTRQSLTLLPLGIALLAWFLVAPDPRFGGAVFWGLAATSMGVLITDSTPSLPDNVLIALGLICAVLLPVQFQIVFPADDTVFHTVPEIQIETVITDYGTSFNRPVVTDQCWDAPLPCAPDYAITRYLCLRNPDTLQNGYAMGTIPNNTCKEPQ